MSFTGGRVYPFGSLIFYLVFITLFFFVFPSIFLFWMNGGPKLGLKKMAGTWGPKSLRTDRLMLNIEVHFANRIPLRPHVLNSPPKHGGVVALFRIVFTVLFNS